MKKFSFFENAADKIVGDNIGGIGIDINDSQATTNDDTDKDFKKEEVLKLVKDYQKKDNSISGDLAKLAIEDDDHVWARAQELALDNKPGLKDFLKTILKADKTGEIQSIVNSLTTAPEPKEEPKEEKQPTAVKVEITDVMVYEYIQRHPKFLEQLDELKKHIKISTVVVYYLRGGKERGEKPLLQHEILPEVIRKFNGDFNKACGPTGWYDSEVRVADSEGNPTDVIYEEPKKGS